MEQDLIQLGIAASCGFIATLILARGWLSAAVVGFLAAQPFAIFSVYMLSGGLNGAGFDAATLPEGSSSLLNFAMMFCIMFGLCGLVGGLVGFVMKKYFRS